VVEFFRFSLLVLGCKRLVVDTVQRLVGLGTQNENQTQIEGRIVKKLDEMAKEMKVIVVLVGQSNKEAEGIQEVKRDEHGVLRGSKELSDVAYAVYLLHRKRKKVGEGEVPTDILEYETDVVLKKDRGRGPAPAVVRLTYQKRTSSFALAATSSQEEAQKELAGPSAYDDPLEF
jgi:replicative DNA helicase